MTYLNLQNLYHFLQMMSQNKADEVIPYMKVLSLRGNCTPTQNQAWFMSYY